MEPADRPFVCTSWLRDAAKSNWARKVNPSDFLTFHGALLDAIFARGAKTLVAYDLAAPDIIWGWLCYEGGTLHYALVKRAFRRLGIGAALWAASGLPETAVFSHLTSTGEDIWRTKLPRGRFIPYAV